MHGFNSQCQPKNRVEFYAEFRAHSGLPLSAIIFLLFMRGYQYTLKQMLCLLWHLFFIDWKHGQLYMNMTPTTPSWRPDFRLFTFMQTHPEHSPSVILNSPTSLYQEALTIIQEDPPVLKGPDQMNCPMISPKRKSFPLFLPCDRGARDCAFFIPVPPRQLAQCFVQKSGF